jgi:hypothetical protein
VRSRRPILTANDHIEEQLADRPSGVGEKGIRRPAGTEADALTGEDLWIWLLDRHGLPSLAEALSDDELVRAVAEQRVLKLSTYPSTYGDPFSSLFFSVIPPEVARRDIHALRQTYFTLPDDREPGDPLTLLVSFPAVCELTEELVERLQRRQQVWGFCRSWEWHEFLRVTLDWLCTKSAYLASVFRTCIITLDTWQWCWPARYLGYAPVPSAATPRSRQRPHPGGGLGQRNESMRFGITVAT